MAQDEARSVITLRLPLYLFIALRAGFEVADDDDAPVNTDALRRVRLALAEAAATTPPGLPTMLTLESEEDLLVLSACWEVGGEDHPSVTEDQWNSINTLISQAGRLR
jgi:hypothetical protein